MPRVIDSLAIEFVAKTSGAQKAMKGLSRGLLAFGAIAAGVTVKSIKMAAEFESTKVSFANLLGSVEKGNKLFADLQKFAAETPFAFKQISSGATTLLGFGLSADEASRAIKELGAAAAANADTDLKRLVVSYGQIQGANVAMTKDLREFVNNGIPIYNLLADTLDVSVSKINDMASAGEITGEVITRVFSEAASAGGKFEKTLISQSKTLAGLTSTLKDKFSIAMGTLGEKLLPAAKEAAQGLSDVMGDLITYFQSDAGVKFAQDLQLAIKNFFDTSKLRLETIRLGFQRMDADLKVVSGNVRLYFEYLKGPLSSDNKIHSLQRLIHESTLDSKELKRAQESAFESIKIVQNANEMILALDRMNKALVGTEKAAKKAGGSLGDGTDSLKEAIAARKKEVIELTNLLKGFSTSFAFGPAELSTGARQDIAEQLKGLGTDFAPDIKVVGQIETIAEAYAKMDRAISASITSSNALADAQLTLGGVMALSMAEGVAGAVAAAQSFGQAARAIISDLIRIGVTAAVSGALKASALAGPLAIGFAAAAGTLAQALFNRILGSIKIPAFGDGGIVYGPTLALIGEKGPEKITPLGRGDGTNIKGRLRANTIWLQQDRYNNVMYRRQGDIY